MIEFQVADHHGEPCGSAFVRPESIDGVVPFIAGQSSTIFLNGNSCLVCGTPSEVCEKIAHAMADAEQMAMKASK